MHHGTCRELTARELETYDIVLTTYGTMMAELAKLEGGVDGPLIRARWLRVVLDEGCSFGCFFQIVSSSVLS